MAYVDLQQKIEGFLASALKKFIIHDYESAIRELKAAEVLDRDNPEILYNLGINYCRMGLNKTAIEYFKRVLQLKHAFIDALEVKKLLAYALIHLNNFKESELYLNQVLQLVPLDVVAMNMKGYCMDVQGNHTEALRIYSAIIEVDKNNYNAYNAVAYIISKSGGDLIKSLQFARIAHESNKENPAYLDTVGYVYLKMGKLDLAERYVAEAAKRAPLSQEINDHVKELHRA